MFEFEGGGVLTVQTDKAQYPTKLNLLVVGMVLSVAMLKLLKRLRLFKWDRLPKGMKFFQLPLLGWKMVLMEIAAFRVYIENYPTIGLSLLVYT